MSDDSHLQQQWKDIQEKTLDALRSHFPLRMGTKSLILHDLRVDESRVLDGDIKSQERAKQYESTWGAHVVGDFSLQDEQTGKTLDRAKVRLLTLPKPTERFTFIVNGNEVQIHQLWKLKSGVYARVDERGEFESEINLAKPFAEAHRLYLPFSPKTREFHLQYAAGKRGEERNFKVPLYPVLRALKVSDTEIRSAWGDEIFKANQVKDPEKAVLDLYKKLRIQGPKDAGPAQAAQVLLEEFHKTGLREDTTKETLGKSFTHVNGEVLLLATSRLLEVARGNRPPDARDALIFKSLHGADDYLHSYLTSKELHEKIGRRLKFTLGRKDRVGDVVPPALFQAPVNAFFGSSSIAVTPEQTNPLETMTNYRTTTVLGADVGGIQSERKLTSSMKLIDPTHLGFLDPLHSPEGPRLGITLRLPVAARKVGNEVKTLAYDLREKKRVLVSPLDLHRESTVLPDQVHWENGHPIAHGAEVKIVQPGTGDIVSAPMSKGRYVLLSPLQIFDESTNLIPFLANNQGNRAGMAAKIQEQAIALHTREAPLVQVGTGGGPTLERVIGALWTRRSPVTGRVEKVVSSPENGHPETIHLKDAAGKSHVVQLYNHFPLNDKESFLHNEVLVKPGDKIQQGQLLADSNYTKGGTLALGRNLRVAYLPHGLNTNDGVVISQSAADKLTSVHVHRLTIDLDSERDLFGNEEVAKQVRVLAGLSAPRESLAKLNKSGIVEVGQKVRLGDVLVAAVGKPNYQEADLERIGRIDKKRLKRVNKSLTWKNDHEGEVVKVVPHPNGHKITVFVKTAEPTEIGDKLSGRHGNKCFDRETEVLCRRGWISVGEVTREDEVWCRDAGIPRWDHPTALHGENYEGLLYSLEGPEISLRVTPNHHLFVQRFGEVGPGLAFAKDCLGESVLHFAPRESGLRRESEKVVIPGLELKPWGRYYEREALEIPEEEYAVLLAAYWNGGSTRGTDIVFRHWGTRWEELQAIVNRYSRFAPSSGLRLILRERRLAAHFASLPVEPQEEILKLLGREAVRIFLEFFVALRAPSTVPAEFADLLQRWGCLSGCPVVLEPRDSSGKFQTVNLGTGAIPSLASGNLEAMVHYQGPVYCMEVPGHVLCVRRHGKTVWSGNSIITSVVPDAEMPRVGGKDGEAVEVLMSPATVPSRINLGQTLETAAAKIAQKTGKPYIVTNFAGPNLDYSERVRKDLLEHGLHDTEAVFDPKTGKRLGEVLVGPQYLLKLKHTAEHKLDYRSYGEGDTGYTSYHAPTGSGSTQPGQAVGALEMYALLSSGARANLREMATYKSDMQTGPHNDTLAHAAFWNRVMRGEPLPPPKTPFVYEKFEALLKGLGVNVRHRDNTLQLVPWTDEEVRKISKGALRNAGQVVRAKNTKELTAGLFDPELTGGLPNGPGRGMTWSHLELPEPVPNPVFVGTSQHPGPAVVLSGLKYAEFEQVARGKKYLGGLTGGPAIEQLLRRVDPEKEIPTLKASLPKLKGQVLDQVNRKLKFLLALQEFGKKPHEVYLTRLVPVLPPIFRPLSPLPDGTLVPDDLNFHYNRLAHLTNELRTFDPSFLDPRKEFLRTQIYDGLRIYAGLTERGVRPLFANMGGKRKAKGILEILRGGEKQQAKEGFIQAKMVKKKQDLSMRATIVPQPNMHLDELGIPREAAFEIYKPFIVQKFTAKGYAPGPALAEVKKRTPIAERLLEQVMEERPVLAKRDPALHQYNFMAYKPKLVEGKAIHIHPLVVTALGGDFDGDQIAAFVPLTEEARREAFKLFPSNRLFSSTTYDVMHTPYHEAIYGLHLISKWGKPHDGRFENLKAAAEAEQTGKIQVTDVIHLGGKKTTLGRELLTAALPELLRKKPLETLGGKTLGQLFSTPEFELVEKVQAPHQVSFATLFTEIARRHPKDYPTSVGQLSQLGSHYAYELGASIGLKDLVVNKKLRAEILHKYDDEAHRLQVAKLPPAERDEKLVALYSRATTEMQEKMGKDLLARGNAYYDWYRTGARGSQSQVMQIAAAPMLMQDAKGRTVPRPVTRSYAEGLDLGDYWTAAHGARTGTLQKSISSQEPGAATKSLINATISTLIESKDCGSTEGISMGVRERDSVDRFLAAPVKVGRKTLPAGTLLSPQALSELLKHKVDQVVVRSPLRCKHGQGICATCFGLSPQGTLYEPGTNIGTLAAQAIGEPMLNVAMKSWHGGGTAAGSGARTAGRFQRMRQLLEMPGHIPNAAVLAEKAGTIDRIAEDTVLNGHHVFVEGHQHFVPAGQALSPNGKPLQVGQKVRKGDALSVGTVNPHDLLELSDIHRVQRYLVDTLHQDILEGKVRKSNLETVIRATTNLTRVLDPGDSPYLRGDVVQRSHVEAHNRDLKPGEKPVGHKPILRHLPVTVLAQHEDWLARLNYRRQKETLLEGVARGWKSSIHGPNPLPSYMLGTQFGLGTKEHPHYY